MSKRQKSLFDPKIVREAIKDSFRKLDPRRMARNPVMFVVYIGSFLTTGLFIQALVVFRVCRRAAACALPRPSAMASAKLANSTVNQSQAEMARINPGAASPSPSSD